jgi:hypothetical protein
LKVGDTVYLERAGNNARYEQGIVPHVIMKIGKKYFYVSPPGREKSEIFWIKFYNDSKRQVTNYTANWEFHETEQSYIDQVRKNQLVEKIRSSFGHWGEIKFSLEKLERINAILEEE